MRHCGLRKVLFFREKKRLSKSNNSTRPIAGISYSCEVVLVLPSPKLVSSRRLKKKYYTTMVVIQHDVIFKYKI